MQPHVCICFLQRHDSSHHRFVYLFPDRSISDTFFASKHFWFAADSRNVCEKDLADISTKLTNCNGKATHYGKYKLICDTAWDNNATTIHEFGRTVLTFFEDTISANYQSLGNRKFNLFTTICLVIWSHSLRNYS